MPWSPEAGIFEAHGARGSVKRGCKPLARGVLDTYGRARPEDPLEIQNDYQLALQENSEYKNGAAFFDLQKMRKPR
jgi:hypothetical protein